MPLNVPANRMVVRSMPVPWTWLCGAGGLCGRLRAEWWQRIRLY